MPTSVTLSEYEILMLNVWLLPEAEEGVRDTTERERPPATCAGRPPTSGADRNQPKWTPHQIRRIVAEAPAKTNRYLRKIPIFSPVIEDLVRTKSSTSRRMTWFAGCSTLKKRNAETTFTRRNNTPNRSISFDIVSRGRMTSSGIKP